MADSLYVDSDRPAGETSEQPGPTVGTVIVALADGTVTHLKWHAPIVAPSNAATLPFVLYDATTQDQLARVVPGSLTLDAWNTVALTTPVHVTAGQRLIVAIYTSNRYVYTGGYFAGGVSRSSPGGYLIAPSSGDDPTGNGRFRGSEDGFPSSTFGGNNYWTDLVFVPDEAESNVDATGAIGLPALTATGSADLLVEVSGAIGLPALDLDGALDLPGEAAGDLLLPALGVTGALDLLAAAAGDLVLPLPSLLGDLLAGGAVAGAITLPGLDLAGTAVAEQPDEPEPDESVIPGTYSRLLDGLRPAVKAAGLRLAAGMADVVGRGEVVVGPPSFEWETLCDPDEPDSVTFSVYLVEAVHERAIDRLLVKLPALIRAVQSYRDATIAGPAVPGAYPAGASDLPCYQLTVEMTL